MSSLSPRPRLADDYETANDRDDPLAELARIVAETSNFEPMRPAARRVEPQVDFEAELINELRASIDVANDHAPPAAAPVANQAAAHVRPAPVPEAYGLRGTTDARQDDAAFDRALAAAPAEPAPTYAEPAYDDRAYAEVNPVAYDDRRYAQTGYADDGYADPAYTDPQYADGQYADGQYADPRYADARYADPAYADPQYVDPAYADPRYADAAYADERDGRADLSLDDFERELAATAAQRVEAGRGDARRPEPAFDSYDDFDDYDRLPPVEGELTADRAAAMAPPAAAALADAPTDGRLGMKLAAAAMGLVIIGGLGFLGYRAFGPTTVASTGGAPPVIKAEQQPAKVVPAGATPSKAESDRVAATNQQRIVARQEEPVDTVGNRQVRVIGPGAPAAEGEDEAPRRVRTVVVRPDGTIVQPNAGATPALPPAPAPAAPAATAPAAPAATASATPPAAPATAAAPAAPAPVLPPAPTPATPAVAAVPAPGVAQPQPAPTRPAAPAAPAAAAPAAAPAAPAAAAPAARPVPPPPATVAATRPVPPAPQNRATPPAAPAPAAAAPLPLVPPAATVATPPATVAAVPAPAATAPASGGGAFVVQLSSQRSEADARRDFQRFQSRFGGLLAGKSADIQTADLGNRGIYYRLRVGPGGSREEAVRLCEQIKSQGGDCVVARR